MWGFVFFLLLPFFGGCSIWIVGCDEELGFEGGREGHLIDSAGRMKGDVRCKCGMA